MAKTTIKKVSTSSWNPGFSMPILSSKKEKLSGKRYSLVEDYTGIGILAVLPMGTVLVECEDKWYQPYISGSKLFFRIGDVIMGKLKLREIVV